MRWSSGEFQVCEKSPNFRLLETFHDRRRKVWRIEQHREHQLLENSHTKAGGYGMFDRVSGESIPHLSGAEVADATCDSQRDRMVVGSWAAAFFPLIC